MALPPPPARPPHRHWTRCCAKLEILHNLTFVLIHRAHAGCGAEPPVSVSPPCTTRPLSTTTSGFNQTLLKNVKPHLALKISTAPCFKNFNHTLM